MTEQASFSLRLIDRLTGPAWRMAKAVRAIDRGLGSLRKSSDGASAGLARTQGAGFGALSVLGGNLATQAVMGIGRVAVATAGAAYEMVTFGQNSRLAFTSLAKYGASGEKLFDHARALAVQFGMSVTDTADNFKHLLAAQFDPKLSTDIIKMGADLRSIGASADDTSGAIRAITQIKGTGRLQGDELNQLANAGISIDLARQEMGKLLGGKTNLEVLKLQEAGKIDADTAIRGILNAVMKKTGEKELGEAGQRFADTTIDGMVGKFKARGSNLAIDLASQIEAPLTRIATRIGDKAFAFLESAEGKETVAAIGRGLEFAANALERAVPLLESFAGGAWEGAGESFRVFASAFEPFAKSLTGGDGKTAHALLKSIGHTLGTLAIAGGAAVVVLGAVAGASLFAANIFGRMGAAIVEGVTRPFTAMVAEVVMWGDTLMATLDAQGMGFGAKMLSIGQQMMIGLGNGILAMATFPLEQIKLVGDGALGALKTALGIASPSKEFARLGAYSAAGFALGLSGGLGGIEHSAADIAPAALGASATSFSGGSTRGGGAVTVTINQTVTAAEGMDEGALARMAARESRREIEALFRQFAEET